MAALWVGGCGASEHGAHDGELPPSSASEEFDQGDAQGTEDAEVAVQERDSALVDRGEDATASIPLPQYDPGQIGPYALGHMEVVIQDHTNPERTLATQVWYPASGFDANALTLYVVGTMGPFELEYPSSYAQREVEVAEGLFPLIIFSHGYGGISTQSIDLCERLASHGFVVASAAHMGNTAEDDFNGTMVPREQALADRPRDVRSLIDTFTDEDTLPELLRGHIDGTQIGVSGHSFGGYTALAAAAGHAASAALPDERVSAIAPICPDSSEFSDEELAALTLPTLFIGGTLDESTPIEPQITRPFALMSQAPRWRIDVVGATHTHFANICTIGAALIDMGLTPDTWEGIGAGALLEIYDETCGEDAFPIAEAIRIQTAYMVAFFRRYLGGEIDYEGLLSADYAEACEPAIVYVQEGVTLSDAPPCFTPRAD